MNNGEYTTRDLYEAAFLVVQGVPVRAFDPGRDGRRISMIFGPEARPLVESYRKGGTVAARDYADALRDLKARLYEAKPVR